MGKSQSLFVQPIFPKDNDKERRGQTGFFATRDAGSHLLESHLYLKDFSAKLKH